jgi:hypothetical protein
VSDADLLHDMLHELMDIKDKVVKLEARVLMLRGTMARVSGDSEPVQIVDEIPPRKEA